MQMVQDKARSRNEDGTSKRLHDLYPSGLIPLHWFLNCHKIQHWADPGLWWREETVKSMKAKSYQKVYDWLQAKFPSLFNTKRNLLETKASSLFHLCLLFSHCHLKFFQSIIQRNFLFLMFTKLLYGKKCF